MSLDFHRSFPEALPQTRHQQRVNERHEQLEAFVENVRFAFAEAVSETIERAPLIPRTVKQALEEIGTHIVQVELYDQPSERTARLEQLDHAWQADLIAADEPLLVVHLPKLMRLYELWRRYLETPTHIASENMYQLITRAYQAGLDALWDKARADAKQMGLRVDRLNAHSHHKNGPGGYYYLWVLVPEGRSVLPTADEAEVDHWENSAEDN